LSSIRDQVRLDAIEDAVERMAKQLEEIERVLAEAQDAIAALQAQKAETCPAS
jgi:prefoldin subunit 5